MESLTVHLRTLFVARRTIPGPELIVEGELSLIIRMAHKLQNEMCHGKIESEFLLIGETKS
jgi:hypothetical protein